MWRDQNHSLRLAPQMRTIRRNMIFSPCPSQLIDHDDLSSEYLDELNVLVGGGVKNRNGLNKAVNSNLVVQSRDGLVSFQVDGFDSESVVNNTVVMGGGGQAYGWCVGSWGANGQPTLENNTYLLPPGSPFECNCEGSFGNWTAWQAAGRDRGSQVAYMDPAHTLARVVEQARRMLDINVGSDAL